MANLVVEGVGSVNLKPGSSLFDIFDRQYWLQEYYEETLKGQGPKFREFKLSEGVHYQYNESTEEELSSENNDESSEEEIITSKECVRPSEEDLDRILDEVDIEPIIKKEDNDSDDAHLD